MEHPILFIIIALTIVAPAGLIIGIRFLLWMDQTRYYQSSLYQLDKMSQEDFEVAVKEKLQSIGYSTTKPRAQSAASIIATAIKGQKDMLGKTTAVVVYKAKARAPCALKTIESAIEAKKKHKAIYGMVITNAFLTKDAAEAALSNDLIIWDRKKLDSMFFGGNWFFAEQLNRFLTEVFSIG